MGGGDGKGVEGVGDARVLQAACLFPHLLRGEVEGWGGGGGGEGVDADAGAAGERSGRDLETLVHLLVLLLHPLLHPGQQAATLLLFPIITSLLEI